MTVTRNATSLAAERSYMDTGETVTVELTAYLQHGFGGALFLHLQGGPTGSEAICVSRLDQVCREGGWVACRGDRDGTDRLWVSPEELSRIRKELGV